MRFSISMMYSPQSVEKSRTASSSLCAASAHNGIRSRSSGGITASMLSHAGKVRYRSQQFLPLQIAVRSVAQFLEPLDRCGLRVGRALDAPLFGVLVVGIVAVEDDTGL